MFRMTFARGKLISLSKFGMQLDNDFLIHLFNFIGFCWFCISLPRVMVDMIMRLTNCEPKISANYSGSDWSYWVHQFLVAI